MTHMIQSAGGVPDEAPGVIIYGLGPLIAGKRKPPVFRVRLAHKFLIENKRGTGTFGRWHALGESADYGAAMTGMLQLNQAELAKHGLSQW